MNHTTDPFREQLGAYVLDRLDEASTRQLQDHLAACPSCRREADELAQVASLLGILEEGDQRLLFEGDARADASTDVPGWLSAALPDHATAQDTRSAGPGGAVPRAPADLIDRVLARESEQHARGYDAAPGQVEPHRTAPSVGGTNHAGTPDELSDRRAAAAPRASRSRRPQRWARWAAPLTAAAAAGAIFVVASHDDAPRTETAESVLAPPAGASTYPRGELTMTSSGGGSDVTLRVRGAVPGMHCVLLLQTGDGARRQVAEWIVNDQGVADVNATTDLRPSNVPRALVETVDHQLLLTGTVATR